MTTTIPGPSTAQQGLRADSDDVRRAELAAFLRSRRERIAPEQVGIPVSGRRRTPGLRREEVAQLAGVGITWYTWLEQGRDIKVSEQVLEAIARTLMLDRDERAHLFTLAGASDQHVARECAAVSPQLHAALAQFEPYPACVQNGKYDVLAYNRTFARMITDLDDLPVESRNVMWLLFTDPRWRKGVVDWDSAAAYMTANLRSLYADHVSDAPWKSFVARLRAASPEFSELWARHDVRGIENKLKRYRNPQVGMLHLNITNLWLAPRNGARLMLYTPNDAETQRRVERLHALVVEQAA